MKMVSEKLKIVTLRVHITVSMMIYITDVKEAWMHVDWFYTTDYAIFGHKVKVTE